MREPSRVSRTEEATSKWIRLPTGSDLTSAKHLAGCGNEAEAMELSIKTDRFFELRTSSQENWAVPPKSEGRPGTLAAVSGVHGPIAAGYQCTVGGPEAGRHPQRDQQSQSEGALTPLPVEDQKRNGRMLSDELDSRRKARIAMNLWN